MIKKELIQKIREIFQASIPERDNIFQQDVTSTINDLASRNILNSSITAANLGGLAASELKARINIAWKNIQKFFEKYDVCFTSNELLEVKEEINKLVITEHERLLNYLKSRLCKMNLSNLLDDIHFSLSKAPGQIISRINGELQIYALSGSSSANELAASLAEMFEELPEIAKQELIKSTQRLKNGDLTGAISSACSAVDSVTSAIYKRFNIEKPGEASFQERCNKSIRLIRAIENTKNGLAKIGWQKSTIKPLINNYKQSLNQSAFVMQMLRSNMSDVHGSKPVFKPLVYNSIIWAALLVRVMNESRNA